ncbi:MAG TPA: ChbG/HpnK family deacetylase [Gammaproteobacteria bacterium]|nr:ChbG/HpnK family deacetylase [Gammaproteobacteria bacterium]
MSSTSRLIVNADDFGIAEAVNRGIAAAFDRGIVTSTSIMATGPAFEHAVELARSRPGLAVGIHLVLTEHRPLIGAAAAASLVEPDGRFPQHVAPLLRKQLRGRIRLAEVRLELEAQLERVRKAGVVLSHIDGHQHVHVLPGIAGVVAELADRHGLAAVRYPAERVRGYMLRSLKHARRVAEQAALRLFCESSPLKHLRRSDDFVGFYFGGRLDEANLATVLAGLPAGRTVELMCHPGDEDMQGADEWVYAWSAERDALTSPRIRDLVAARGLELISYRDV